MTYRDQIEFKIRKLTRAIDALADLPDFSEVTKLAEKLNRERGRLRRTIADGRRSCGECGNPMTLDNNRATPRFLCESEGCESIGWIR
jgi:hypothetical protein